MQDQQQDGEKAKSSDADFIILLKWAAVIASILLLGRLAIVGRNQLNAPFDLVFETPNLTSIKVIQEGYNPYDPALYAQPPYNITVYTPLYHYLVSLFPFDRANPFFYGRIVACVAMLAAAASLFVVDIRHRNLLLSLIAISVFFGVWPVLQNTVFLKTDTLALCLAVFAVVTAHNFRGHIAAPVASAALAILAISSKQYFVASGATCAIFYLLNDRRQFFIFLFSSVLFVTIFLTIVSTCWGNGFWFSTIGVLRQDMTWEQGAKQFAKYLCQPLVWFVLILTGVVTWEAYRKQRFELFRKTPYFLYILTSMAIVLIIIWRIGSSTNYFAEPLLAALLWVVYLLLQHDFTSVLSKQPLWRGLSMLKVGGLFFLACCAYEYCGPIKPDQYAFITSESKLKMMKYYKMVRDTVTDLDIENPLILNLFSHRDTYIVTDQDSVNDPYGYSLFWKEEKIPAQPMVDNLNNKTYDIVVLSKSMTPENKETGPYGEIIHAVFANYKLEKKGFVQAYYVRREETDG